MKPVLALVFTVSCAAAQQWTFSESGSTSSLRGLSVVSPQIVWAGGTQGAFLRTTDGGAHWDVGALPGAADLDFRDIEAFDERHAILMSSGAGSLSRLYRTKDGGMSWSLLTTNTDPKGFWDAIAFWDPDHGILLGDPVDGRFTILTTSDGGMTWRREKGPSALKDEGAFAASGTSITTHGAHDAWFGTGGPSGARIFHSSDDGKTWSGAKAPLKSGDSAGVFSLAFSDARHGIAVGGDSRADKDASGTMAVTEDGGKTWTDAAGLTGYRSSVRYIPEKKLWIATGTSGTDISTDGGKTWKPIPGAFHSLGHSGPSIWAVGAKGAIAKLP